MKIGDENMIKFGPSGTDADFAAAGFSRTIDVPTYIKGMGLDVFEYSFGRGVRITKDTAISIGQEFSNKNVGISVHAPYYINFATDDDIKRRATFDYMLQSLSALDYFGGTRCVFHPGSPLKYERCIAMTRLLDSVKMFMDEFYDLGFSDKYICAETMGKINQLGDLNEVISICNIDDHIIPCVDFGHLNARSYGSLKSKDDYRRVIDTLIDGIGENKTKKMHVHFSKIEYGKGGEVKHLTFDDNIYGPEFEPLSEIIVEYKLEPWVICESSGTQSRDAKTMKDIYCQNNKNN